MLRFAFIRDCRLRWASLTRWDAFSLKRLELGVILYLDYVNRWGIMLRLRRSFLIIRLEVDRASADRTRILISIFLIIVMDVFSAIVNRVNSSAILFRVSWAWLFVCHPIAVTLSLIDGRRLIFWACVIDMYVVDGTGGLVSNMLQIFWVLYWINSTVFAFLKDLYLVTWTFILIGLWSL